MTREEDIALARAEARQIQAAHAAMFESPPVPITEVAQALGLRVDRRPGLVQRARLEIREGEGRRTATIFLRAELGLVVGRFAVAHEIGHAILLMSHPDAARAWDTPRREAFANAFAAELLACPALRANEADKFRTLTNPLDLLRLASRLGMSVRALLTLASQEPTWTSNLDKIWLRVQYAGNAFTGRDAKLRVVSAHYDRGRFFIPTNQSLARLVGEDDWLGSLPVGVVTHHRANITIKVKRPEPAVPKFVPREAPTDLSAVRLTSSSANGAAYFIILADLAAVPSQD